MLSKIKKIINCKYKYLFSNSIVILNSSCEIGTNTKIINSNIEVLPGSKLIINNNCSLLNVRMVVKGEVIIGEGNFIDNAGLFKKLLINVNNGTVLIGKRNRLQSDIKVRFGGFLTIGDHNNINEESEIRCDEKITIGNFNQLSYKCVIWDTNTHNIYPDEIRRELTVKHYPKFGYEFEKPKTAPVYIGNDCWIGREVAVLKGVTINNSTIVGYRATLSNEIVQDNSTVVPQIINTVFKRKTVNS